MSDLGSLHKKLDLIAERLNAYSIEEVETVMRREKYNDDDTVTQIIDFYPPWKYEGRYGQHKVVSEYLNFPWQVDRFENFSGLNVDDIPCYLSGNKTQALMRTYGRPNKCETAVIFPFKLMIQPQPADVPGEQSKKTLIVEYIRLPRQANAAPAPRPEQKKTTPPPPPQLQPDQHDFSHVLSATDSVAFFSRLTVLVVARGSELDEVQVKGVVGKIVPEWKFDQSNSLAMVTAVLDYLAQRKLNDPTMPRAESHATAVKSAAKKYADIAPKGGNLPQDKREAKTSTTSPQPPEPTPEGKKEPVEPEPEHRAAFDANFPKRSGDYVPPVGEDGNYRYKGGDLVETRDEGDFLAYCAKHGRQPYDLEVLTRAKAVGGF